MARYDKKVLLGSGSYGKVWVVETQNSQKEQKVLKEIKLSGLGDRDVEQALTEVAILSKCRHANIIGYTEAFVNRVTSKLSIIMDYASGGDLHKQITQRRGLYFPNEVILSWFSQLISALSYIHKRGILHRDIKPQNLFLNERHVLKIGDFGISRILHGDADVAVTFVGTPFYLSPEICSQQPYSYKSDIWSAGCVLYEMCCLRVPFTAVNLPSLVTQIQTGLYSPLPGHCGDVLYDLVRSLLTSDPEKRLSADDILQLPTIQEYLRDKSGTTSELLRGGILYPSFSGRQSPSRTNRMRKKRSLESDNVETQEESNNRGISFLFQNDTDAKKDPERKICSTTYTVVKYPEMRHMSFASPELSAVLARQRTLLSEPKRALSADAPRVTKSKKHKTPPRQNLFQAMNQMKPINSDYVDQENDKMEESSSNILESVAEAVYSSVIMETRPHAAATEILNFLLRTLGQQEVEALIAAVRSKTPYQYLQNSFHIQPPVALAVLWYVKLSEI